MEMKHKYDIQEEIEKTLNSLEEIDQASPKPFFLTRLEARLEKELEAPKRVARYVFRPVPVFATLVLLLGINLFALQTTPKHGVDFDRNDYIESVMEDYSIQAFDVSYYQGN